jgi:hypothetical protein
MHWRSITTVSCLSAAAVTLLLSAGCVEPESPTLCVLSSTELDGATPESAQCPVAAGTEDGPQPLPGIPDGAVYFIRHELPDGVEPIGKLAIHIETPCGDEDLEAEHARGVVLISRVASLGTECSLSIQAKMANSELLLERGSAAACASFVLDADGKCVPASR